MRRTTALVIGLLLLGMLALAPGALACGGFFCTNIPVDQTAERIIFAVNEAAGTIDAYVQINYTGSPDQFAWVVPVPNPPKVDVADIAMFDELDRLTQPQYLSPPLPADCPIPMPAAEGGGVTVFEQGSVGPYDYAVVGSDDPRAMVSWLRENGYRITQEMEPLVDVYTKERMVFLAMKLQPQKGVQDIQPVKMTYRSSKPMIPLRLTAVAANPDMVVLTWILAKSQAAPENYAPIRIPDDQIVFTMFGGSNYTTLVSQEADRQGGRAFVTEYAGATAQLRPSRDDLRALLSQYPYLTRVYTRISPEEMTVDPVFRFDSTLADVSNVHDLSNEVVWDCAAGNTRQASIVGAATGFARGLTQGGAAPYIAGGLALLALGLAGGWLLARRRVR